MATITSSGNITSGFVDLATFDEMDKYLYGGPNAVAYFVRCVKKSTWFTQVPMALRCATGSAAFNQEACWAISRAGDYLQHVWLRVQVPSITTDNGTDVVHWTRNLMHNLIRETWVSFNDLVAMRFDSYWLDFWSAFTVPASKRNGYDNMIGNINDLIDPIAAGQVAGNANLPQTTLNLPLPYFFCRDSGVALPTAALPYNEMQIGVEFRNFTEVLNSYDDATGVTTAYSLTEHLAATSDSAAPAFSQVQMWANYAIVSNEERVKMGKCPRDIVIEQVQEVPRQSLTPATVSQPQIDIRLSHSVKALFFGVRNTTRPSIQSNYTAASPTYTTGVGINYSPADAADPIQETSLIYENTTRLSRMGSDYFSLVAPYYHAPVIPSETGYHVYSYALDFADLDPKGSTNYGKLTNVSVALTIATVAVTTAAGADGAAGNTGQTFEFILMALNFNVVRISGQQKFFSFYSQEYETDLFCSAQKNIPPPTSKLCRWENGWDLGGNSLPKIQMLVACC